MHLFWNWDIKGKIKTARLNCSASFSQYFDFDIIILDYLRLINIIYNRNPVCVRDHQVDLIHICRKHASKLLFLVGRRRRGWFDWYFLVLSQKIRSLKVIEGYRMSQRGSNNWNFKISFDLNAWIYLNRYIGYLKLNSTAMISNLFGYKLYFI